MDPITDYRAGTASITISKYMSRVFSWMTFGLLITSVVAYVIGSNTELMKSIVSSGSYTALFLLQLGLVFGLSFGIKKMSVGVATLCFLLYAFSVGVTSSVIFAIYQLDSIGQIFAVTAGMFACLAFYGAVTKKDLSAFGTFLFMALFGGIIAMVINIFVHSSALSLGLSVMFVFVFAGLTAWDTQRIKSYALLGDTESDMAHKMAIFGALALYLDFINLFFQLLNLMGNRRRN